jgi:uncharacterized membrane protein
MRPSTVKGYCQGVAQLPNPSQTSTGARERSFSGTSDIDKIRHWSPEMKMSSSNVNRLEKFKTITTEVFALTLGLGAFSLSTVPRESLADAVTAVGAFAIAFFYIAWIWVIHSRFFENYPLYDQTFIGLNFVMLFLVAISPFMMQSVLASARFQEPMSVMFALDMMSVYLILGVLHQRYIQQNKRGLGLEEFVRAKADRNVQFILSAWFLTSTLVPIPYRFVFWMLVSPLIPLYYHGIARIAHAHTNR